MKTFVILQKIVLFRVDWKMLYSPHEYELILIVHAPTFSHLKTDQKACFSQIHVLPDFNIKSVSTILENMMTTTSHEIHIITNDELCIEMTAELRQYFHLKGDKPDRIKVFVDKEKTKKILEPAGICLPKYLRFCPQLFNDNPTDYIEKISKQLELPIFAKPINSAASQHTSKLDSLATLFDWCKQHADKSHFELDEFITGKLYHCESIIYNNAILFSRIGENAHPCFEFMSGKITGSITLSDKDPLIPRLLHFNTEVLNALQPLPNGVIHMEIFHCPNDQLVFLEVACRAPGGMIVQMHEKQCGINFEQAQFAMQMDLSFNTKFHRGPHCAWAWFPQKKGKVVAFSPLEIKSPHEIKWKIKKGETYKEAESLIDYAGSIFLWNEDYNALRQDFTYLSNLKNTPVEVL